MFDSRADQMEHSVPLLQCFLYDGGNHLLCLGLCIAPKKRCNGGESLATRCSI